MSLADWYKNKPCSDNPDERNVKDAIKVVGYHRPLPVYIQYVKGFIYYHKYHIEIHKLTDAKAIIKCEICLN